MFWKRSNGWKCLVSSLHRQITVWRGLLLTWPCPSSAGQYSTIPDILSRVRYFSTFSQPNNPWYVRSSLAVEAKASALFFLDRHGCAVLFIVKPISIWPVYIDWSTVLTAIRRPHHRRCISICFRNQRSIGKRALSSINCIRDWMMRIRNSQKQRQQPAKTMIHCVLFVVHIGYKQNSAHVNIKRVCKWCTDHLMLACHASISA